MDLVREFGVRGLEFFYARDASACRTAVQPRMEACHGLLSSVRNDLDGAIGQVAGMTADGQPLGFESRAVAKIHALHPARDQKITSYSFHPALPAVR